MTTGTDSFGVEATVSDMIRRFREGRPTSRKVRDEGRDSGLAPRKMWYDAVAIRRSDDGDDAAEEPVRRSKGEERRETNAEELAERGKDHGRGVTDGSRRGNDDDDSSVPKLRSDPSRRENEVDRIGAGPTPAASKFVRSSLLPLPPERDGERGRARYRFALPDSSSESSSGVEESDTEDPFLAGAAPHVPDATLAGGLENCDVKCEQSNINQSSSSADGNEENEEKHSVLPAASSMPSSTLSMGELSAVCDGSKAKLSPQNGALLAPTDKNTDGGSEKNADSNDASLPFSISEVSQNLENSLYTFHETWVGKKEPAASSIWNDGDDEGRNEPTKRESVTAMNENGNFESSTERPSGDADSGGVLDHKNPPAAPSRREKNAERGSEERSSVSPRTDGANVVRDVPNEGDDVSKTDVAPDFEAGSERRDGRISDDDDERRRSVTNNRRVGSVLERRSAASRVAGHSGEAISASVENGSGDEEENGAAPVRCAEEVMIAEETDQRSSSSQSSADDVHEGATATHDSIITGLDVALKRMKERLDAEATSDEVTETRMCKQKADGGRKEGMKSLCDAALSHKVYDDPRYTMVNMHADKNPHIDIAKNIPLPPSPRPKNETGNTDSEPPEKRRRAPQPRLPFHQSERFIRLSALESRVFDNNSDESLDDRILKLDAFKEIRSLHCHLLNDTLGMTV